MRWIDAWRPACLTACLLYALQPAGAGQPPAAAGAAPQAAAPSTPSQTPTPSRPQTHFVVAIDAAHGGNDAGARLSDRLLEKDLVLALSVRLRSMLSARGVPVVTTREFDTAMPAVNRADIANRAVAAACLTLHATSSGTGVHLFTSSLTPIPLTRFLPWDTAQGAYTESSLKLASEVDAAMQQAEIPVTLGRVAIEPLDSFACPAVAIELAPLAGRSVTPITDPEYQSRVVSAIAAAIEQWRSGWRQQP